MKINNQGQVTIFIILGVILVVGIMLFFILRNFMAPSEPGISPEEAPQSYLRVCTEDIVNSVARKITLQGGYLESQDFSKNFMFSDESSPTNISYLCYTEGFYSPCINQKPLLINHLTKELKKGVEEEVENCFYDYISSLENRGFEVQEEYNGFNVVLIPGKIILEIKGKASIKKADKTTTQENFEIVYPGKFYDLAIIVQEIVNQEAGFCNFDHSSYMLANPDISIDKFRSGDSILIYRIIHKKSKEIFKFAIRGCVYPPGI
jgi:hypothetical protein